MAEKFTQAFVKENYLVASETEGFNYTMDYTERFPDRVSQGTSPTGLLIVSLVGCHLMTSVSYFNMKKISFDILKGQIEADFVDSKDGWELEAKVIITTDAKLTKDGVQGLSRFIHRHCKVSSMLSRGNNIQVEYRFV